MTDIDYHPSWRHSQSDEPTLYCWTYCSEEDGIRVFQYQGIWWISAQRTKPTRWSIQERIEEFHARALLLTPAEEVFTWARGTISA